MGLEHRADDICFPPGTYDAKFFLLRMRTCVRGERTLRLRGNYNLLLFVE